MIERRADGTIPGEPQFARIHKSVYQGKICMRHIQGERLEDMRDPSGHPSFRGWLTDVIPYSDLKATSEALLKTEWFTKDEERQETLRWIREEAADRHRRTVEQVNYYLRSLPEGEHRDAETAIFNKFLEAGKAAFK